ncbi:MAG TPA: hypothetical protein VKQ08_00075 [Cyclobacteriaceae bacterium]|nr:hypothetical protein [Cyclobacteriaceae bacterium]
MEKIETSDIETVREQTRFLHNLQKQLATGGKVILTTDDLDTIDRVTETLNSFRMYLSMFNRQDAFAKPVSNSDR